MAGGMPGTACVGSARRATARSAKNLWEGPMADPGLEQLRREPFPLRGRVALVTGASRRAGIGYAVARRLAALGASLFLHSYAPHDRQQPWGDDPGGAEAVIAGVRSALAAPDASVSHLELDLARPEAPAELAGAA